MESKKKDTNVLRYKIEIDLQKQKTNLWLPKGKVGKGYIRGLGLIYIYYFPSGSDSKESACNSGDPGLIPGLGRSPGEGNGNTLQYSCLENPMDGGTWRATVHGVAKS